MSTKKSPKYTHESKQTIIYSPINHQYSISHHVKKRLKTSRFFKISPSKASSYMVIKALKKAP